MALQKSQQKGSFLVDMPVQGGIMSPTIHSQWKPRPLLLRGIFFPDFSLIYFGSLMPGCDIR